MPRSPRLPGLPGCYCQVANFWRKGPGCPLCTVYPNSIQAYLRGTYHAFSHRGIHANLHADMHTRYCASLNRLFCSSQGFVCFVLFLFSFPFSKYQQLPGYIYMAGAHFKNSSLPLSVSRARQVPMQVAMSRCVCRWCILSTHIITLNRPCHSEVYKEQSYINAYSVITWKWFISQLEVVWSSVIKKSLPTNPPSLLPSGETLS